MGTRWVIGVPTSSKWHLAQPVVYRRSYGTRGTGELFSDTAEAVNFHKELETVQSALKSRVSKL